MNTSGTKTVLSSPGMKSLAVLRPHHPVTAMLTCLGLASLTLPALSASTLLSEDFTGNRLTSSLPTTSAWYSSGTSGSIAYDTTNGGSITQTVNGTTSQLLTYFTSAGDPVSLGVGEALSVRFDFRLSDIFDTSGAFRIGLFSSGGNRIAADNQKTSNVVFTNYTGYAFYLNPGADSDTSLSISKRDKSSTNLLNNSDAMTGLGGGTATILEAGVTCTGVLSLIRTGDDIMSITFSILDGSGSILTTMSCEDASGFTSFDTLAFVGMNSSSKLKSFTLENVSILSIPEPRATITGLAACAAIVALAKRFRRISPRRER
ncbi:MAG: hypothetical protein LBK99_25460 [Opitutaceae bacterium]|nr:hypothetical protein [Opitutaceae bacterium]